MEIYACGTYALEEPETERKKTSKGMNYLPFLHQGTFFCLLNKVCLRGLAEMKLH